MRWFDVDIWPDVDVPRQLAVAEQSRGILTAVGCLQAYAVERIEVTGPIFTDGDRLAIHEACLIAPRVQVLTARHGRSGPLQADG